MAIKKCPHCKNSFSVLKEDVLFLEKFSIKIGEKTFALPDPVLCPDCRQQRRLAFRNERNLYERTCDACHKKNISVYHPMAKAPIYCQSCWWSDGWDPLAHGFSFDFSRSFFKQFEGLLHNVPRPAILNRNSTHSEYTHICEDNKNGYLLVESSTNEDCFYSYWIQKSKNCTDCSYCTECELCYECDHCQKCYNTCFLQNCQTCYDSWFLKNCIGCKNCFYCINLKQKEFCIFNKQYSSQDYFKMLESFKKNEPTWLKKTQKMFSDWEKTHIHKYAEIYASEDCTGDYLSHSKNCYHCFCASEAWDCRYGYNLWRDSKDNGDVDTCGMNSELNYECINTAIDSSRNIGCARCWGVHNSFYCNECDYSQHLLGCIGLRHKKYCILNRQYTQKEYESLVPKIIESMQKAKEWGQFFPMALSPFAYHETVAQDYFPSPQERNLVKNETKTDENEKNIKTCSTCEKHYKIITQELKFYEHHHLPLPQACPNCRHSHRLKNRNPRQLWQRPCAQCHAEMTSSFSPERPEIIFCENCYLKAVY